MLLENGDNAERKPLRILTIDNGGLQAISLLRVLDDVCEKLSEQDGHKTPLRPCELFDIIGGIGTGGWLSILLGRYRLRIDQCMSIYVTIANAIDPKRQKHARISAPSGPVALDQDILIRKIDKIIAEHRIGEFLFDQKLDETINSRKCHAFAVGVVKRPDRNTQQEYRLFRTYDLKAEAKHEGPDPAKCKISWACAATAAAKDFLGEYRLEDDKTTYWDDTFPHTHNVSCLALDEANSIFGQDTNVDFVLNLSPGIVSAKDVTELQETANPPTRTRRLRRWLSARDPQKSGAGPIWLPLRAQTDPGMKANHKKPQRSDTGSSTSSDASDKELDHQKTIRERLRRHAEMTGRDHIYFRLELPERDHKPYLDDIARPDVAMQLAEDFLDQETTKLVLAEMASNVITRPEPRKSFTGEEYTSSPNTSETNLNNTPVMRTTKCES